jgi:hypothetical protein
LNRLRPAAPALALAPRLSLRVGAAIPRLPTESKGLAHSKRLTHSEGLSAAAEVRLPTSEPLTGAETAARIASRLRCQLLDELVER